MRSNRVAIGTARAYPEGHMTNAPDFSLDDELDATRDWVEPDWADEPDPEEAPTVGAMELAERHALRRVELHPTFVKDRLESELD